MKSKKPTKAARNTSVIFLSGVTAMAIALITGLLGQANLSVSALIVGFTLVITGMLSALILVTKQLSKSGSGNTATDTLAELIFIVLSALP